MNKKEFWVRFSIWTTLSLIAPLTYLFATTKLFYTVNKVSVWAVIIIFIIAKFFIKLWKYVNEGIPYSMAVQVISGVVKIIIPLLALYFLVLIVRLKVNEMLLAFRAVEIFLYILIPCELVAIPVNPFPKWIYLNQDKIFVQKINKILNK